MANTLGVYNPLFYAQEALIHLESALGMAARIHRGYDEERRSATKGEIINIRKPSTFTEGDAPLTTDKDVATETVAITLDNWKEVKFNLTDKELTISEDRIISDHIRPAAYALANGMEGRLTQLVENIPWHQNLNAAPGSVVADLTKVHQILFDNGVPMDPGMLHYMVDGAMQEGLLANAAFTQWTGAGAEGAAQQMRGTLGNRFGMEMFATQNIKTHTKGTCDDTALLTNGTPAKGATSFDLDAATVTGTLVPGDTFVIAGNTQRYAITNTTTAATNAYTAVTFTPGLAVAPGDGAAVTIELDTHVMNCAFHRNAFALATAPLSTMGAALGGAKIATVTDPATQLSIRSRIWYDPDNSRVKVALDVLYGYVTLDPNLGVRGRG